MGRRKTCDKLGEEHEWQDHYISIGGWFLGKTQARLETKCKKCSKVKPPEEGKKTFFIWDNEIDKWRNLTKEEQDTWDRRD